MAGDDLTGAEIDAIVARAGRAQQLFEYWTEERVDALLFDLSSAFHRRADVFAAALVEESGLGQAADKAARIREVSVAVYESLAGRIGHGPLETLPGDSDRDVTEVASPLGV